MLLYSFAVGPSQVYPQVAGFYQEAFQANFPSESHRGKAFMAVFERAVAGVRAKLAVPEDYSIFFTGSATECWEMLSQAYAHKGAFHAYSGSFGEKWHEYGKGVAPASEGYRFGIEDDADVILNRIGGTPSLIALTLNETSNGTALSFDLLKKIQAAHPEAILAIDTTSDMAGVALPWPDADVWFASVQKCFGLPAGLAVMVVSPKAKVLAHKAPGNFYNSISAYLKFAGINQTPFTPPMLPIYSLARLMETVPAIAEVDAMIARRAERLFAWLDGHPRLKPLVYRKENRSPTVIAVLVPEGSLARYQQAALAAGYELGRGYGAWKDTTFRLANFPAVDEAHLEAIMAVLDAVE